MWAAQHARSLEALLRRVLNASIETLGPDHPVARPGDRPSCDLTYRVAAAEFASGASDVVEVHGLVAHL